MTPLSPIPGLQAALSASLGKPVHNLEFAPLGGGSINHAYRLLLNRSEAFFCKVNSAERYPGLFEKEKNGLELLAGKGYEQYEVSAYAQTGRRARHNLNYWNFGDYLGIGAGAHGKLTDPEGRVTRLWKLKHPEAYLESAGTPKSLGGVSRVAGADLAFEFMLNRLRLVDAFNASDFESATGLGVEHIEAGVQRALDLGLLEPALGGWQTTARGQNYLNDLQSLFLPAQDANRKANA